MCKMPNPNSGYQSLAEQTENNGCFNSQFMIRVFLCFGLSKSKFEILNPGPNTLFLAR